MVKMKRPGKVFTFKSFNDLLNDVNINLIKRIDPLAVSHANEDEDSSSSHFFTCLKGFVDFNLTGDFRELRRKLGNYSSLSSLPQVVYRKDELFSILIEALEKPNSQATGEAIALLSALARDIGVDYYAYFEKTFTTLVNLLDCQDSELIENVFMCFALLFQLLWRPMLKDIKKIFRLYSDTLFSYKTKDFIRTFAAQSFTYLARKVPKKAILVEIILKRLSSSSDISSGVSDLFFEIVKGIKRQFHSCASEFLSHIFWIYATNYQDTQTVTDTIKNSVQLICHHIDIDNSAELWNCLFNLSNKALDKPSTLKPIVTLIDLVTSFKDAQLVRESDFLIDFIAKLLQDDKYFNCFPDLLHSSATLLNASLFIVKHEKRQILIKSCLGQIISNSDAHLFAKSLFSHRLFDSEVLPVFLNRCYDDLDKNFADKVDSQVVLNTLEGLFQLVTCRRPLPILEAIPSFDKFTLQFFKEDADVSEHVIKIYEQILDNLTDLSVARMAINVIPHIYCEHPTQLVTCLLARYLEKIRVSLLRNDNQLDRDLEQLMIEQTVFAELIYFLSVLDLQIIGSVNIVLDDFSTLFSLYPYDAVILQAFLFYIQATACENILDRQFCEEIYFNHLENNLSHPFHQVRLLTLMCINLFDFPMQPSENGISRSIFSISLEAELVPVSVQTYREKLRLLNLLDLNFVSSCLPLPSIGGRKYDLAPILYLLGNLFCNFNLIWDPVKKLIEIYGKGIKDKKSFWTLFSNHMTSIVMAIKSRKDVKLVTLWAKMNEPNELNPKIDYHNHRILLLQIIKSFGDSIGSYTQQIVNWLIDFVREEMSERLDLASIKAFENLRVPTSGLQDNSNGKGDRSEEEEEEDHNEIDDDKDEEKDAKFLWNTLRSFLEIMASIKNQAKYDQQQNLSNLYVSLLQNKNSIIQKLTLDCVIAYNSKQLAPYKENLHRLLDDLTFKTEILLLAVKSDNLEENLLKANDRSFVIPFIMRILYGKLFSKTGIKTAGKANIDARRSIIFRFLASCSRDEIMIFTELSFSSILPYFRLDYEKIIPALSEMDITKSIPLRRLLGYLKTLDLMLIHFGNIATDLLPDLLKIILIISSLVKILLAKRSELSASAVTRLKNLRLECFKLAEKYFQIFDYYPYKLEEIQLLFQVLIDPMVDNVQNESLESPSPILRLLYCWSENSRYFILFARQSSFNDRPKSTPISNLIALYNNDKASLSVVEYITALIANLVSYENHSPGKKEGDKILGPFIPVECVDDKDLQSKYTESSQECNFGTYLVKPHISGILNRIKKSIEQRIKKKIKNKNSIISEDELVIIAYISDHIELQKDCAILANLLIQTIYHNSNQPEDVQCKTLRSINSLIKRMKNTAKFLAKIACLFGKISQRSARLELCEIVSTISSSNNRYKIIAEITRMINAYDPRNPEEPDYVARGDGFRLAKKTIEETTLTKFDAHLLFILIYNCFFFIKTSDDLGLRESSSSCLQTILHRVSNECNIDFVKKEIIPLVVRNVKSGMKELNELARHEYITVLTYLVQYLKDKHPLIRQLSLLSDDKDPELDFWSNIRHIQVHRRIRALARLSTNHELLSKFSPQIHQDFLLPIATTFIADLRPTKYGASINYAVDLIGSLSKHLPWPMYDRLLRIYLKKTVVDNDNHKTNVKILCVILGNFNFNLNNSALIKDAKKLASSSDNSTEERDTPKRLLNQESATKIHKTIIEDILPKLHSCLHKLSYSDYEYDVIRSEFNYEDEIHRIPMATAMVKLLRSIPITQEVFDTNVKSIFLRLSSFLKSRMDSIREAARQTLCKTMAIIGPKYLSLLIDEMKAVLNRGYRLHVLTFSLYIIIEHMSPNLNSGDLDDISSTIIEIFHSELFTDKAEEKSVGKITSKCKEAKKMKTFAMYRFLGKFISGSNLITTIIPLKQVLDQATTPKVIKKVSNCMQKFFQGLLENNGTNEIDLLNFALNVVEDKIPQLKAAKPKETKKAKVRDSFIIQPQVKQKKVSKANPVSNVFVLFENCLKLVLSMFKKGKITHNPESNEIVNKFVPIFINSLQSKHAKVSSAAIRCISQITLKNPNLSTYKAEVGTIKKNILVLLDEFIGHGSNTSENCELITMCFKCLSLMIKFVEDISLAKDELQMLLFHVEKDMNDRSRRSTAFSLLKAILGKKIDSPLLKGIMEKLTMIMLHSDEDYVREEARLIWTKYLLNHSLGNQFSNYVHFFTRQLEYPREIGRVSVLKLIFSIIKYQNVGHVSDSSAIFFIALSSLLINDDSVKCRELASQIIKKLIMRISKRARDSLFTEVTLSWFIGNNNLHRRLAAQLCGLFVSAEGKDFRKRLPDCLSLLSQQLEPKKFTQSFQDDEDNDEKRHKDHLLFQLLNFFHKILIFDFEAVEDVKFIQDFNCVFFHVENNYLSYPHMWIRIISVNIIQTLFTQTPQQKLLQSLSSSPTPTVQSYLNLNTSERLWRLCKKHCLLFNSIYESHEIQDPILQNLLFIGKFCLNISSKSREKSFTVKNEHEVKNGKVGTDEEDTDNEEKNKQKSVKNIKHFNISWMMNRMLAEIKREVSRNPNQYEARLLVFKWLTRIMDAIDDVELVETNLSLIMVPLCREITSRKVKDVGKLSEDDIKSVLVTECLKLYELLKEKVGREAFTLVYTQVATMHNRKRNERKAARAIELITNPVKALKRKAKMHHAWNETKKRRKIEKLGGISRKRARSQ